MSAGRRSEVTRARILDAAVSLGSERGLEAVSVTGVGRAVGLSAPTVAGHFRSRADLLAEAVDFDVARMVAEAAEGWPGGSGNPHRRWPAAWAALAAALDRHPLVQQVLAHPGTATVPRMDEMPSVRLLVERFAVEIDRMQRSGVARPSLAPDVAATGLAQIVIAVFVAHVQLGVADDPARIEAILAVLRAVLDDGRGRRSLTRRHGTRRPRPEPPVVGRGPKGEATRMRLLDAAVPMFGANGFRSTSVAQVAREVGISPAAGFAHFGSKEELFHRAFDHDAMALIDRVGVDLATVDVVDRWPAVVALMWGALSDFPLVRRSIQGRERELAPGLLDTPAIRLGIAALADRIAEGQRGGAVRGDIDEVLLAGGLVEVAMCLLVAWAQGGLAPAADRDAPWAVVLGSVLRPA